MQTSNTLNCKQKKFDMPGNNVKRNLTSDEKAGIIQCITSNYDQNLDKGETTNRSRYKP